MGTPQVLRFDWPSMADCAASIFPCRQRMESRFRSPSSTISIAVNFDRRQIVYQMVERLFGWGKETDPVMLPAGVGVPLAKGQHLGVYAMWHNDSGQRHPQRVSQDDACVHPQGEACRIRCFRMYVDVNNHIGGVTTFDVPPGKVDAQHTSSSFR